MCFWFGFCAHVDLICKVAIPSKNKIDLLVLIYALGLVLFFYTSGIRCNLSEMLAARWRGGLGGRRLFPTAIWTWNIALKALEDSWIWQVLERHNRCMCFIFLLFLPPKYWHKRRCGIVIANSHVVAWLNRVLRENLADSSTTKMVRYSSFSCIFHQGPLNGLGAKLLIPKSRDTWPLYVVPPLV